VRPDIVKVLHLIDPASPGGGACTLRLLAEPLRRLSSVEQDVLVLGSRRHGDLARSCGVEVRGLISPPLNRPVLARKSLAHTINMLELNEGAYDVIHAWTLASGLLATWAVPHRKRVATLAVGPVSGVDLHLLKRLLGQYELPMLASSSAVEQEYRSMGLGETPLSILPPAVNPEFGGAGVARSAPQAMARRTRTRSSSGCFPNR
jgi:hypothetical protein